MDSEDWPRSFASGLSVDYLQSRPYRSDRMPLLIEVFFDVIAVCSAQIAEEVSARVGETQLLRRSYLR